MIVSCDGAVAAALAAAHGQPFGGAETREAFVTAETVQNALVIHFMLNLRKRERERERELIGTQATQRSPVLQRKEMYVMLCATGRVVTHKPNLYVQKWL